MHLFADEVMPKVNAAIGTRDTGYEYAGGGQARPKAVWNDGHATYFEFRQAVRPSIFAVDSEGLELTVNSQTRGRVVRVGGVAEAFTNMPGKYVKVADTVRSFKEIVEGQHDALPEDAFLYVGAVEEAVAKGKALLA